MKKLDGKNILVVDDEEDLREIIRDELELEGAHVLLAKNGTEAFALVKSESIDAIVSDIRMPNGDGVELLKSSKQLFPDRPVVILITGNSDYKPEVVYDAGACALMNKPLDFETLIDRLALEVQEKKFRYVRAFERIDTDFSIEFKIIENGQLMRVRALNIGQGGLFISMLAPLPPKDARVYFKFIFNKEEFHGTGFCRWQRETQTSDSSLPGGIGLEFDKLSNATFVAVEKIIALSRTKSYIPIS